MSVIHLVRHGQASFGADDYDLLSALGERQSRVLGQALAGIGPRIVHAASGEMRRQRQTAEACLGAMGGMGAAQVDPGLHALRVELIQRHRRMRGRTRDARGALQQVEQRRAAHRRFPT